MKRRHAGGIPVCLLALWLAGCPTDGGDPPGNAGNAPDPGGEAGASLSGYALSETGRELEFAFSSPVRNAAVLFDPELDHEAPEGNGTATIKVRLNETPDPGSSRRVIITAEDGRGKSVRAEIRLTWEEVPPEPVPETVFLGAAATGERRIFFEFSAPVKNAVVESGPQVQSVEEGTTVKVLLKENLAPGVETDFTLSAEDGRGRPVRAQAAISFAGGGTPGLVINEIRTEIEDKFQNIPHPRVEFIEFKTLSAGNLAGLRVFVAGNNTGGRFREIYTFRPVEVRENEYFVLHLRSLEGDLCIDEYGDDLAESGGRDSSPTARDFWVPTGDKLLGKNAAVYVQDSDGRIPDAVMITDDPERGDWRLVVLRDAAKFLSENNAWGSPDGNPGTPADAIDASGVGTGVTGSISRDESSAITGTKEGWFFTGGGGATPGEPNVPKPASP